MNTFQSYWAKQLWISTASPHKKTGFFTGYDIDTNAGTANSVATSVMRFVASFMPAYFSYYDRVGRKLQSKEISDSFYKPFEMYDPDTLDQILRGLIKGHAQYENDIPPSSFTKDQLNEIRKVSLGSVICDNSESIDFVQPNVFIEADPFLNALMSCDGDVLIKKMSIRKWATASPRFIVPDNMLVDAIERARRDVRKVKNQEWNLWNTGQMADSKSPIGTGYGFMRPKQQFLDNLLQADESGQKYRQLKLSLIHI